MKKIIMTLLVVTYMLVANNLQTDIENVVRQSKVDNLTKRLPVDVATQYMALQFRQHIDALKQLHPEVDRAEIKEQYIEELRKQYTVNDNPIALLPHPYIEDLTVDTNITVNNISFTFKEYVSLTLFSLANSRGADIPEYLILSLAKDSTVNVFKMYPRYLVEDTFDLVINNMKKDNK